MEAILTKKRNEIIKEGLVYIDNWENECTKKDCPDLYEKYLKEKKKYLKNDEPSQWDQYIRILDIIKRDFKEDQFYECFTDLLNEIENYINIFKPKVFLKREDLDQVNKNVKIVNDLSPILDTERKKYNFKCSLFLVIQTLLLDKKTIA